MKKKVISLCLLISTVAVLTGCGEKSDAYWRVKVEDYEVSLQNGEVENSLEVVVSKGRDEWCVMNFDMTDGYRKPEDITIDTFEDVMGHSGFRIYEHFTEGESLEFCDTDYYAVDEEPIHLAFGWGAWEERSDNFYSVDLDGDGVTELLCNVQWLGDGAMDTIIYHWDGEKVMHCYGTDVMMAEESGVEIATAGSVGAEYHLEENKLEAWFWDEKQQDFVEKKYDIDLTKLEMWEYK